MSNKILVLLIGVLMVLMLGMGGGLFLMWNKLSDIDIQVKNANAGTQSSYPAAADQPLGPIYALETFIVNLADKGGKRYLRVTMALELGNNELESEVEKRLPQVRDSILMILPSKQFADVSSVDGKTALRDEILAKLNEFLTQGKVTNIYFKEFVVQ